jgi:HTH-type transcriptional regulator/antitoxin HigA
MGDPTALRNTREGDELDLLSMLVHAYEDEAFPIDLPDPVDAIRFRMDQQGLMPRDLVPFIGSRSRVSEVLSGRRTLSLNMIRALSSGLKIPAAVLVGMAIPAAVVREQSRRWITKSSSRRVPAKT